MAKLKADHRFAMHNFMQINTVLRTSKKENTCTADVPDLKDLFTLLNERVGYKKIYENKRVVLTLTDVKFSGSDQNNPEHCCVMINVRDKTAGTGVIVEDITGEHQDVPLPQGKSWGVSMHVLFDLTPKASLYHVIYEQVPDVNHSRFISFVNHMFFDVVKNNESEFTRNVRNQEIDPKTNKVKTERFKLSFTIDPMPYDEFANSLDAGKISDIQVIKLVDNNTRNNVDGHTEIIERAHIVKIQTPKLTTGKMDYFKSIGDKYSEKYNRLKFNFTNENGVSGNIEMNTQDMHLENLVKAFSKKSKISGFSTNLKDSYKSIHKPIMDKLIEVI